jgi:hypothetical protein
MSFNLSMVNSAAAVICWESTVCYEHYGFAKLIYIQLSMACETHYWPLFLYCNLLVYSILTSKYDNYCSITLNSVASTLI